jgi:hypothetical protein
MNAVGAKAPAAEVTTFIYGKTAPPADVTGLTATHVITGGIRLSWDPNTELDLSKYFVAYSPRTTGSLFNGITIVGWTPATYMNISVAKTGTYLVRAQDTTFHSSRNFATVTIASVPSNIGLTSHAIIEEHPAWAGTKTNMSAAAGVLSVVGSDPVENLGVYTAGSTVDFGSVKIARVSATCLFSITSYLTGSITDWDAISDFDADITGNSYLQPYIYTSQDSSEPTFKQPLFAGDYVFQRAKFTIESLEHLPDLVEITELTITVDLHDTVITI